MLSVFLLFMRGNCFSSSLMFIEVPPAEYWEIVAEQRRKALLEALEENKMVRCQAIFIYSSIGIIKTYILTENGSVPCQSTIFRTTCIIALACFFSKNGSKIQSAHTLPKCTSIWDVVAQ